MKTAGLQDYLHPAGMGGLFLLNISHVLHTVWIPSSCDDDDDNDNDDDDDDAGDNDNDDNGYN